MIIKTFTEILAWQKAHQLTLEIYKITSQFPKTEQFGLISQMRRCAVSIPSNIAEGFKRKSLNDSLHFYNIAEGSLEELKYQLLLAKDLDYLNKEVYGELSELSDEVGKLLNGWKKSQR
ncbi:MAG: four helix bundle protein [bacterium]|nr:four helix bundle protein [bacterium]